MAMSMVHVLSSSDLSTSTEFIRFTAMSLSKPDSRKLSSISTAALLCAAALYPVPIPSLSANVYLPLLPSINEKLSPETLLPYLGIRATPVVSLRFSASIYLSIHPPMYSEHPSSLRTILLPVDSETTLSITSVHFLAPPQEPCCTVTSYLPHIPL